MKTAFHRLPAGHARLCSEPPTHASRKPRVWGRDPCFLRGPKDIPKPRPSPGVCTTASHGLPEAQPSATIIYSINPQFDPPDSELSHTLADAKTPGLQVRTGRTCSREAGAQHPGVGGCAGDGVLLRTRKAPPLQHGPSPSAGGHITVPFCRKKRQESSVGRQQLPQSTLPERWSCSRELREAAGPGLCFLVGRRVPTGNTEGLEHCGACPASVPAFTPQTRTCTHVCTRTHMHVHPQHLNEVPSAGVSTPRGPGGLEKQGKT